MTNIDEYLKQIDEVIKAGPYTDDWDSLKQRKIPEWFSKGKFGLFIHWGAFTVPECESEWYPRQMYLKGTKSCRHKEEHYGKNADYRQIAEQFNPQKFNADEWLSIFKKSGAKYIMPVGEHHDGIKLYQSDLNRWNTMEMAPHRDFMKELHTVCDTSDMGFLISNHRAEHYWFMNGARKNYPQSEVLKEEYKDLYGDCALPPSNEIIPDSGKLEPTEEWLRDWLASACEMVDKNKPRGMYFDWWIQQLPFKPYLKKFLAYYYNRAYEWGIEPVVFYKYNAMMQGCAVFDVERGQVNGIAREPWQCDTAIAKNSWGYTKNNDYKSAYDCITNLIDVVSKNGCLMLNVGPKADGTICDEEKAVLLKIGKWLQRNGEAIYDTEPFTAFGEGKKQSAGAFKENLKYTTYDYRFTFKTGAIYVFPLSAKARKNFYIRSLRKDNNKGITYKIKNVSVLGSSQKVEWKQDMLGFKISLERKIISELPICIKIEID